MYGCWVYPFNYEEYKNRENEIDDLIKGFGEEKFSFDEDEYEPLDEAYIVKLDIEAYGAEYNGYYFVVIGGSHYDYESLDAAVFGLDAEYEKYNALRKKSYDSLTEEEKQLCFVCAGKYEVIEGSELGEEFEELIGGEEVSCGKIIKKIF